MSKSLDPLRDRFRGVLLGTHCGDALGMPVEGWTADQIRSEFGLLNNMSHGRLARGSFTDDTEMTLALAQALVDGQGGFEEQQLARTFAEHLHAGRGYGRNTLAILFEVRDRVPWELAVRRKGQTGGSHGNGAAMRVAPVALAAFGDADRLRDLAVRQARVTGHGHPDALFGAQLQALAVMRALQLGLAGRPLGGRAFLSELLQELPEVPAPRFSAALSWLLDHWDAPATAVVAQVGVGVYIGASLPVALWAALTADPAEGAEGMVVRTVNLGGDADTTGAMAGALAGAYYGAAGLPVRWLKALEGGKNARDRIDQLADALWAQDQSRRAGGATTL